jgi:BirA family biotin operon repressor/biotin-[acetyl-CoA-carboxylase] ligase
VSTNIRLERLRESLCIERFGKRIFYSRVVSSTSDWAKELVKMGAEEGTVTLAQTQTAGRGRLGRKWDSPIGGLWFSIILRPNQKASEAIKLVFVASLAVAEVLHEKYRLRTETKWPNDVLVEGRKICGILVEMNTKGEDVNYAIVGVGLNANFCADDTLSETVRPRVTSIEMELGRKIRLEGLLQALLEKIENVYFEFARAGFAPILEKWKTYAGFLGHMVVVSDQEERLKGLALDVDSEGALILKLRDGTTKRIIVGNVIS